jgi:c-di-GMP-binding flagellar brake protein YcgR
VTGPRIGEAVHVIAPSGASVAARVKDADSATYVLRLEQPEPRELFAGTTVSVEFTNRRGVCRIVGDAETAAGDALRIAAKGAVELIQRRDHVRVDAYVPVTYHPYGPEGRTVTANTLEVSGGGFRLAAAEGLRLGDMLRFTVELGEGESPLATVAEVVREGPDGEFGMRFVEILERDRDRLVRWVFARERLARQIARHP